LGAPVGIDLSLFVHAPSRGLDPRQAMFDSGQLRRVAGRGGLVRIDEQFFDRAKTLAAGKRKHPEPPEIYSSRGIFHFANRITENNWPSVKSVSAKSQCWQTKMKY